MCFLYSLKVSKGGRCCNPDSVLLSIGSGCCGSGGLSSSCYRTFSPLSFPPCQEQSQGLLCHCRRMAQSTGFCLFYFVLFQDYKKTKLSGLLDVELLSLLEDQGIQVREPWGSLGHLCHECLSGRTKFCLEFPSVFWHIRKYSLCA